MGRYSAPLRRVYTRYTRGLQPFGCRQAHVLGGLFDLGVQARGDGRSRHGLACLPRGAPAMVVQGGPTRARPKRFREFFPRRAEAWAWRRRVKRRAGIAQRFRAKLHASPLKVRGNGDNGEHRRAQALCRGGWGRLRPVLASGSEPVRERRLGTRARQDVDRG